MDKSSLRRSAPLPSNRSLRTLPRSGAALVLGSVCLGVFPAQASVMPVAGALPSVPEPWFRRPAPWPKTAAARALLGVPAFIDQNSVFGLSDVGVRSIPRAADLDGDGDLDVFIGESNGDVHYFENTGGAAAPAFASAQINPFGLSNVGDSAAPAFADLDNDGDLDAFVGNGDGDTLYFENTGTAGAPSFAAPVTNPFGLANTQGFTSVPAFVDLDNDGDLDAVIGEGYGVFNYFENVGTAGAPSFTERTGALNPFNGLDTDFYSSPMLADLDGDGDFDLVAGGLGGEVFYAENTGSAANPSFASLVTGAFGLEDSGDRSAPTLMDLDGDGDLDAFVGESNGLAKYFENTGDASNPAFVFATPNPLGLVDVGVRSAPALVDIDGDGDLDAFVGEAGPAIGVSGTVFYYENTGTAAAPAFAAASANPFGLALLGFDTAPAFVDFDGDGDLDAFFGERLGRLFYFENTGTALAPAFGPRQINPFGCAPSGVANTAAAFADVDNDGDFDVFVGVADGSLLYFENTGDAANPSCAAPVTNPFGITAVASLNKPAAEDLDGDGDVDVFVGAEDGTIVCFENTGGAASPAFLMHDVLSNPLAFVDVGVESAPAFGDLDADGDLDFLTGAENGTLLYYLHEATADVPVTLAPVNPPIVIPPGGGQFNFDVTVTNTTPDPVTVDLWLLLTKSDAGINLTRGPVTITLSPGETLMRTLSQNVPGGAPSGEYLYTANVGDFPVTIDATDSFTFTKQAGAALGPNVVNDWDLLGEEAFIVGTEDESEALPERFGLAQNFPNPFHPSTEITYNLPEARHVRLVVYDLQGREVAVLLDGPVAAGLHAVSWRAGDLPSGLYLYRIEAGDFVETRTMMLVK